MIAKILLTAVIFLGIDAVWLGVLAKPFYDKQLAPFNRSLNLTAAIGVYLLLIAGILLFVLPKAGSDPTQALLWGAVFGLISYGVYDLTNMATLADWSWNLVIVDMLWGAFLCGVTSCLVVLIINFISR